MKDDGGQRIFFSLPFPFCQDISIVIILPVSMHRQKRDNRESSARKEVCVLRVTKTNRYKKNRTHIPER